MNKFSLEKVTEISKINTADMIELGLPLYDLSYEEGYFNDGNHLFEDFSIIDLYLKDNSMLKSYEIDFDYKKILESESIEFLENLRSFYPSKSQLQ